LRFCEITRFVSLVCGWEVFISVSCYFTALSSAAYICGIYELRCCRSCNVWFRSLLEYFWRSVRSFSAFSVGWPSCFLGTSRILLVGACSCLFMSVGLCLFPVFCFPFLFARFACLFVFWIAWFVKCPCSFGFSSLVDFSKSFHICSVLFTLFSMGHVPIGHAVSVFYCLRCVCVSRVRSLPYPFPKYGHFRFSRASLTFCWCVLAICLGTYVWSGAFC